MTTGVALLKRNAMLKALKIEGHYRARKNEIKEHILVFNIVQRQLAFSSLQEIIITQKLKSLHFLNLPEKFKK